MRSRVRRPRKARYGDLTTDVFVSAAGVSVFAGHWTHLTQTIAFTLSARNAAACLVELQAFYDSYQAIPTLHIANSDPALERVLGLHGYTHRGRSRILYRAAESLAPVPHATVRGVGTAQLQPWRRLVEQAFATAGSIDGAREAACVVGCMRHCRHFVASVDGFGDCGAAAMAAYGDVGILFCDGTIPAARGLRVQQAMIRHRVTAAREIGCEYVCALVEPGSASERNYIASGFRISHERHTWQRAPQS